MREITITVRVSPEEKRLIELGAKLEKLQPSTYMRRLALLESEKYANANRASVGTPNVQGE